MKRVEGSKLLELLRSADQILVEVSVDQEDATRTPSTTPVQIPISK